MSRERNSSCSFRPIVLKLHRWLCPRHTKYVGVYSFRFSVSPFVCTYIRSFIFPSQGQRFCVKVYKTSYFEDLFIAPACSRVRYRRPIFCPSVRPSVSPSVRQSVRLSTFMSTFDIYVKVSILINYKTKQPSNFAWNISLTSWLCDIGVRFSVCLSIRPSVCQHLCRRSTFMSKLVF